MRVESIQIPAEVPREEFLRLVNDAISRLGSAVNANDARAIIVEGSSASDLPTAGFELRGRTALLARADGSGANDGLYLCRKNAADAYEWVLIV